MTHDIAIRPEAPADFEAIRTVHAEAFGQPDEADLVERLRDDGEFVAALSAVRDGHVVGHIVFSRLPITAVNRKIAGAALAPLAVLPRWQRHGAGSVLVRSGLRHCAGLGIEAVVVLGHPTYYPRFGFSATLAQQLQAPFSGPAFMATALLPEAGEHLRNGATVRYARAFGTEDPSRR